MKIIGTSMWTGALALGVSLLAAPTLQAQKAAGISSVGWLEVSPWIELHNARARLLAGPPATKADKAYLAGVEITLAEGWKTYWRMPGDAGVPPTFDWTGSANVATIKVLYPAPSRIYEAGAEILGYKGSVLFPVEVVPEYASQPLALALTIEFGVCREICIPAEAKMSLTLRPEAMTGEPPSALLTALERVPRQPVNRRLIDPQLRRVVAKLEGPAPRLTIEATFPQGGESADAFVEATDGLYLPLPRRLRDASQDTARLEAGANDALVRFEVDLGGIDVPRELTG
jgi:DsbC/DsbD-like thiol-disulfide interchange protein